jgi:hypothetical protein
LPAAAINAGLFLQPRKLHTSMKPQLRKGIMLAVLYIVIKWTTIGLIGVYLYKQEWWSNWYLLFIPVIVLAVYAIKIKLNKQPSYRRFFVSGLKRHFPGTAESIIAEVDNEFRTISRSTSFAASSANPMDKRLDFAAYFLSLIKVLEGRKQGYSEIRKICLDITVAYVSPRNSVHALVKRLPAKMIGLWITRPLIRILNARISVKGHEQGFRARIITDKLETHGLGYGVDILECGICKLFARHDASLYSSILCEVDKVTTGLAGLQMIRTGTIALGAPKCDFRYQKSQSKPV